MRLLSLPGSFLAPKPPYQSQRRGILLLFQDPEAVRQEVWMVGSVPAPFCPHNEPVRELSLQGERVFLNHLRRPGEETTVVGKVFGPRGDCDHRCELIASVAGTAAHVQRCRRRQQALDYVVSFQAQGEFGRCLPSQVSVEDM